jgi:hypothetical protein
VLALSEKRAPELVAIEVGAVVAARRLHVRIGRALATLMHRRGTGSGMPYRTLWDLLEIRRDCVQADLITEETPVLAWERWLRQKVIHRG